MKPDLFTVGHSNQSWEQFLELLKPHGIQVIIDVRSSPYSAWMPQFNREPMKAGLQAAGIRYLFLGAELGARRTERECYVDGVARYHLIAQTESFQSGLARVTDGIKQFRCALMCAEKDPLECHRTILVCRHLRDAARIAHIRSDGSLESHEDAETRLMAEENIPTADLFATHDELLARAYDKRGEGIAFQESSETVRSS